MLVSADLLEDELRKSGEISAAHNKTNSRKKPVRSHSLTGTTSVAGSESESGNIGVDDGADSSHDASNAGFDDIGDLSADSIPSMPLEMPSRTELSAREAKGGSGSGAAGGREVSVNGGVYLRTLRNSAQHLLDGVCVCVCVSSVRVSVPVFGRMFFCALPSRTALVGMGSRGDSGSCGDAAGGREVSVNGGVYLRTLRN